MSLTFWCLPKFESGWGEFWKILLASYYFGQHDSPSGRPIDWNEIVGSLAWCTTCLHVARLHSRNVAYSPLHTLSPATTIHSIHVAILPHTFCIPSAVKERSWRANGSSHFGAPAYFLKRHSLPEFGLRGEMIISGKQNTSFYHHDQQRCLSRKV